MLSSTHIVVARHFYTKLQKKDLPFELNKRAFLYGNILPDAKRHLFNVHYWDESKSDYEFYLAKAIDKQLSDIERSESLGIVCHFMCDYFCKYHTIEPYKQIIDSRHCMYEASLHIKLKTMMFKRRIIGLDSIEEAIFSGSELCNLVRKNGELDNLMNTYRLQKESLLTDLTFQFAAVRAALMTTLNLDRIELEDETQAYTNMGQQFLWSMLRK